MIDHRQRLIANAKRTYAHLRRPPEDLFAGAEDVAERQEAEVRSPAIDRAINDWNAAKAEGDDQSLRMAAKAIVDATSATFRQQGVPTFAHPVLPPQFVKAELLNVGGSARDHQKAFVAQLVDKLDRSARPGALLQFDAQLAAAQAYVPTPRAKPMNLSSDPRMPRPKPQRPIPYNTKDPMRPHAPTWMPEEDERTWGEWFMSWFQEPEPKLPVEVVRRGDVGWDEEVRDRSAAGARNRGRQEQFDDDRARSGVPLTPDEQVRRDVATQHRQRTGKEPLYFSPKAPHPDDPYKDRVAWPVQPQFDENDPDVVTKSPWGERTIDRVKQYHPGMDFRNRKDDPVFSPKNGTILKIEKNSGEPGGNQIFVLLDDGSIVGFAHTGALEGLEAGDEVYAGQMIGVSDGSGKNKDGSSVIPHTHISYYPPGTPVDPETMKPLQGPSPHSPATQARTQSNPLTGLGYQRPPRRLNPEGYTGQQPTREDRK